MECHDIVNFQKVAAQHHLLQYHTMQGVGYADDCPPSIVRGLAPDKGIALGAESSSA